MEISDEWHPQLGFCLSCWIFAESTDAHTFRLLALATIFERKVYCRRMGTKETFTDPSRYKRFWIRNMQVYGANLVERKNVRFVMDLIFLKVIYAKFIFYCSAISKYAKLSCIILGVNLYVSFNQKKNTTCSLR